MVEVMLGTVVVDKSVLDTVLYGGSSFHIRDHYHNFVAKSSLHNIKLRIKVK